MAQYVAEALSTGDARNGHTRTANGYVDLDLAVPQELGGPGGGTNPEDLFAAGYAACFHGALKLVARNHKKELDDSTSVGVRVALTSSDTGFDLSVEIEVFIPNLPEDEAQTLAEEAHQVCPYSKATRNNIPVTISVAQD